MLLDRPEDNKNNDELLNDLRQKLASQSNLEYEEKRNDLNVSKNVFIGAVSGIVLAGIVGWFVLSPQYAADTRTKFRLSAAPKTPLKFSRKIRAEWKSSIRIKLSITLLIKKASVTHRL